MNVTLYANVSANGRILLSSNASYELPAEIIGLNIRDINRAGNLVMGRKSFENFERAFGGMAKVREVLPEVRFVWLSASARPAEGYHVAATPDEAVSYLRGQGFETALIGGGTETYNAFLAQNLITDLVINTAPVFTSGGILGKDEFATTSFDLTGHEALNGGFVQSRYRATLA